MKQTLVMFWVKFTQKMHKTEVTIFEKKGERGQIYMVIYIKISMKVRVHQGLFDGAIIKTWYTLIWSLVHFHLTPRNSLI